jgi:hypothetical protein
MMGGYEQERERLLRRARIMPEIPALQTRSLGHRLVWEKVIKDMVALRLVSMERPAPFRICRGSSTIRRKEPHTEGAGHAQYHHPDAVWHGWDVHKDTTSVAVFHDEPSVRRLIDRCADRRLLRVCYEAAPHRLRAAAAARQHGRAL